MWFNSSATHSTKAAPDGFFIVTFLLLEQNDKNKHFCVNKLDILSIFVGQKKRN